MSDIEVAEYRQHPVPGQMEVESIDGFQQIAPLIRHHHEHVDGSGYPEGVKRGSIPLGRRIIALADAVDRIVNRGAISEEILKESLKHVEFYLGTRYDRLIFQAIRAIIGKKIQALDRQDDMLAGETEMHLAESTDGIVRGVVLDHTIMGALRRYHRIDPPWTESFVKKQYKGQQK